MVDSRLQDAYEREEKTNQQRQHNRKIAEKAAEVFAGKDLHRLSLKESELVKLLEAAGLIVPNQPANGFVGTLKPYSLGETMMIDGRL